MKGSHLSISSATNRACNWLYSASVAGTAAFAGSVTYFGSAYYITTTQKILSKQLPSFDNKVARALINTLGVPGISIRYLAQIANLVGKMRQLVNEPKYDQSVKQKILQAFFTLLSASCAGIGAAMLTDIQAEEYEFEYNPLWLATAIPLALGGMEIIEALLGGLDIDNIKKLISYLSKNNAVHDTVSIATADVENFPHPRITRGITIAGTTLILFSFVTIVDDFRRNILDEKDSPNNSIGFTIGILGNLLQMLLDEEKLSEILQKFHRKEITAGLGTLSLALGFVSSSLSFIMAYEFGETCESSHEMSVTLAIIATLPKAITAFMFIYPALEYANGEISKKIEEFKKIISERSTESIPLLSDSTRGSINSPPRSNNNCCNIVLNKLRFC